MSDSEFNGFALAPWHLWGTGETMSPLVSALPSPDNYVTSQLARITYKRPETWGFFFSAEILTPSSAGIGPAVDVLFDLDIGVGRSVSKIAGFCRISFTAAEVLAMTKKATTVTRGPNLDPSGTAFFPLIEHFPAENIQCRARVAAFTLGGGGTLGTTVVVQAESFFAPLSHVRPEWWRDARGDSTRFMGDEAGGT